MKINLNDLAQQFDLQQIGDANHEINGVATLESAQANQLSFLANSQYTSLLKETNAGIVIMSIDNHDAFNVGCRC